MRDKKRKSVSRPRKWLSRLVYRSLLVFNFARMGSGEEKSYIDTFFKSIDFGDSQNDFS